MVNTMTSKMTESKGETKAKSLHVNNLLCYATTACHSMKTDEVVRICITFYKETEILKSKEYLCQIVEERNTHRLNEDRLVNEMKEIMDIIPCCDDKDITLPKFVAGSYDGLPPTLGFEVVANYMVQLIDELTNLRKEVAQLKEIRQEERICNQEIAFIKEDLLEIKGKVRKLYHNILSDSIQRDSILLESFENSAKALEKHHLDKQDLVPISTKNDDLEKLLNASMMSPGASQIAKVIDDNCSPRHGVASQLLPYWQQEVQDFGGDPSAPSYADVTPSAIREIRRTESGTATSGQRNVEQNTRKSPVRGEKVKKDLISHCRKNQDVNNEKHNRMPTIDKDGFQLVRNIKRKP